MSSMDALTDFQLHAEETQQARDELSIRVLKKIDEQVADILLQIPFAALYIADLKSKRWRRADIEGSLYCARRSTAPKYRLFILNKVKKDNFIEDITERHGVEVRKQFVFIWSPSSTNSSNRSIQPLLPSTDPTTLRNKSNTYAIWCYFLSKCDELGYFLQNAIDELQMESQTQLDEAHLQFSQIIKEFGALRQLDNIFVDSAKSREQEKPASASNGNPADTAVNIDLKRSEKVTNGVFMTEINSSTETSIRNGNQLSSLGFLPNHSRAAGQAILSMLKPAEAKHEVINSDRGTIERDMHANGRHNEALAAVVAPAFCPPSAIVPSLEHVALPKKEGIIRTTEDVAESSFSFSSMIVHPPSVQESQPTGLKDKTSIFSNNFEIVNSASSLPKSETEVDMEQNLLELLQQSNGKYSSSDGTSVEASVDRLSALHLEPKVELGNYLVDPLQLLINSKVHETSIDNLEREPGKEMASSDYVIIKRDKLVATLINVFQTEEFQDLFWKQLKHN